MILTLETVQGSPADRCGRQGVCFCAVLLSVACLASRAG